MNLNKCDGCCKDISMDVDFGGLIIQSMVILIVVRNVMIDIWRC